MDVDNYVVEVDRQLVACAKVGLDLLESNDLRDRFPNVRAGRAQTLGG
jgi:hypothetical protein